MTTERPNLARARRKLASFMIDTCRIVRDSEQQQDDVLDVTTGLLVPPNPDAGLIYAGPCLVNPTGVGREEGQEGRATELEGLRAYRAFVPLDVPEIKVHDRFIITSSVRDPGLVDEDFDVVGSRYSTFAVARQLDLKVER